MARKIVNNTDPGTSSVFGGDDTDYINKYLTGVDQSSTDPVVIATTTTFKNSKFLLRNPADTASYIVVPSAITVSRNLTLPLLGSDDTVATLAAVQTFTNKTIDTALNPIKNLRENAVYTIFIDGTTVKARNNITGVIDYTADNTVDAVTAITSAINNIKNITGATLDTTYAARIHIAAGVYKCVTNLLISDVSGSANREGVAITGEGTGTVLNFIPSGALTNAITFTNSFAELENVKISANSNVVNYILILAPTPGTTDWKGSRGKIEKVYFEGANWGSTYLPITGQTGIKQDGSTGSPFEYFWRIIECDFASLDTGILSTGTYATSTFQDNNSFLYCTTGIDIATSQHIVSNMWCQGTNSAGTTGIRLRAAASYNVISNVTSEMQLPTTCQTVLLDSGTANNILTNIQNATANGTTSFVITDNSASNTNYITYLDNTQVPQIKVNDGSYITGATAKLGFSGGNVVEVKPITASQLGALRITPTYSTVVNTNPRAVFHLRNTSDETNNEYAEFVAWGTFGYLLHSTSAGSGVIRPLHIGMNGSPAISINIDGSMNFNSRTVSNAVINDTVQSPVISRTGWLMPVAGTTLTTATALGGMLLQHVITGTGTVSNTFDTTDGVLFNIASGASAGNVAGLISPTAGVGVGRRLFGMKAVFRGKIDSTTTSKFLFGFTSATTLPVAAATQPLAIADHGVIVGFVETGTGSTNWTIWHNDGATSVTTDNVGAGIAKDANMHTIEINWTASGNINIVFDGTSQAISADLPATTANLYFNCVAVNTAAAARTLTAKGVWIQADE